MISVVIPALNEEDSIEKVVSHLLSICSKHKMKGAQVVVVDDGSEDDTAEHAAAAGATVVTHLKTLGYGKSLKDGIDAADNDTIVIIDADGTYPIDRIPEMVAEYEKGYDMVVGARSGQHYRESWFKMPLRRLLRFLVEFSSGDKIPDVNSGLRVFSRTTVQQYFKQLSNSFSFTTSVTLAYLMTSKCIHYMPIEYHERVGRSKVRLFRDSLRTLQYIVQALLYYNPIKIFLLFCALVLAFAVFCFAMSAWLKLTSAFMLGIGCILLSILLFSLGLLADLLRQILIK